jgi:hypothetical protein
MRVLLYYFICMSLLALSRLPLTMEEDQNKRSNELSVSKTYILRMVSRLEPTLWLWRFNNISVISWRSVLLVEETEVPGENHGPAASL